MSASTRDAVAVAAAEFATLDELREAALAGLDPDVRDFLEGGAGTETTIRRNREAFDRWALRPRVMSGRDRVDLSTQFLGIRLSFPVLTAPFGADRLFHPDGQLAVGRANAAAGTASIVPEAGSHALEDVIAASRGRAFGQLHPMGPEENFARMLRRYERAGAAGLCVTCDCPTGGWRERNLRNRWSPPIEVLSGNYPVDGGVDVDEVFGQLFKIDAPVWGWDRLAELMSTTSLPWIAKGILTPEDAVAARAAGASAILVSSHGGRQLDGVVGALDALPPIRATLPDIPIALDSGVRRGSDIAVALALGADVVVLGRTAVYGLAADGQVGVERTLSLLRDELRTVLVLLGRGGVRELSSDALCPAPQGSGW